ncbi:MAG: aminoacyl-tRNA hydrolase [Deltaproteobacteria bacterium]
MFLIAGLGNPGSEYEDTRHNVGFMLIDRLAEACGIKFKRSGKALCARGLLAGEDVVLLKPQTFMNLSGEAVARFSGEYRVGAESIVAAYDDCDLPLGRIRIRKGGGSGGHKGVNSIITRLGNGDFARVRLGIGRPFYGDVADYVLSPFEPPEAEALDAMLKRGAGSVEAIITRGIDCAMNIFNSAP